MSDEKLEPMVDRLWSQLRYAYEHGGGHSGHISNAAHTATALSKEIRRLKAERDELRDELQSYHKREKTIGVLA